MQNWLLQYENEFVASNGWTVQIKSVSTTNSNLIDFKQSHIEIYSINGGYSGSMGYFTHRPCKVPITISWTTELTPYWSHIWQAIKEAEIDRYCPCCRGAKLEALMH